VNDTAIISLLSVDPRVPTEELIDDGTFDCWKVVRPFGVFSLTVHRVTVFHPSA
jgi:hypothetical protein